MFTRIEDEVVWEKVHARRKDLVNYLMTLDDVQWNTDSLCDGWRVRDVLAHLILEYHYTVSNSWLDFIRSGFRINTFLQKTAVSLGQKSPDELITMFKAMENEKRIPKSLPAINALIDLLIHEQDIRIPLNEPKSMDKELLHLILSHWEPGDYNFGEKITGTAQRVKGLEFVIQDLGITKGDGIKVIGNAQDVLMAIAGRRTAIKRLTGPGVIVLKSRLS